MKTAKLTAPLDYFTLCPFCDNEITTNITGKTKCDKCNKYFIVEFDQHYFGAQASYNIIENKQS